jgi:DNA primase catalytic core
MPRISESEIARLKDEVSLVRLVEAAGVKLEKRGKDRVGCCPFHDDKTPSFVVSPDKNLWNCLGACGEGGDVIGFVQKLEGVSFRHAVELLKQDHAPSADAAPVKRATTQKLEPFAADADDAAMLARVTAFYHATLKQSPEALDYLASRGLNHPDLIDTFSLGYANRSLGYRLPMKNRQAGAEIRGQLQQLGILRKSGHEHLTGSLVVPVTDEQGQVCQMYGRKIRDDLRKGTPTHLYLPAPHRAVWNLAGLIKTEEVILCESLIDAMSFWCAGYRNVTCSYGTNGFTDAHREAFQCHDVRRVLIAYDRDAAGDKAAEAHAKLLMADGVECFRILFPKGMDANAYALQVTPAPQSLGALIRSAEWMGSGKPPARRTPVPCASGPKPEGRRRDRPEVDPEPVPQAETTRPAAKDKTPDTQPSAEAAGAAEPDEDLAEIQDTPEAPCSPVPAGPAEIDAEISKHEVAFAFGDRRWRVRGLERNTSYETLRINLLVSREISGADSFHVDTLDLYAARQRTAYVREAAAELGLAKETVKADMARVLLKLEDLQDAQIKDALAPAEPVHEMTPEERAEAVGFLQRPDLLDAIAADAQACGVVGERSNLLVAYLAAVSRKLDKPLAVLVQSTSAAGKSALMDAVLAFLPEEDQVSYAAMTGQALFYLGETALKRKVLAIAEEEGARDAAYALKLLQSQGSLAIASTGKDPVTGKLVTQDYKIEGPMALMMTTTAIDLDEELKNRCLVLTVNETRDQTAAIHDRQRFEETLDGLMAKRTKDAILAKHQNAQRLLKPLAVVNPFAQHLTFLADKTRTRRDHGKYLALIRAIAVLHQHQREIRTLTGPDGNPVEYIEATLDDIAAANDLAHEVLGRTLDELPPQTRTLLNILHGLVTERGRATGVNPSEYWFSRREVREVTGWSQTQLRVHLGRLQELEYILPHRGMRGQSYVYELVYDGQGSDGDAFVMGLIDVDALRNDDGTPGAPCGYDGKLAGVDPNLAGSKRPQNGAMAGTWRAGTSGENASSDKASQPAEPKTTPDARPGVSKPPSSYTNGHIGAH